MQKLVALVPLAIAGIRTRDLLIAAVVVIVVVILVVAALASRRRAAPRLDIHELEAAEGQGYLDEFQAIENEFVDRPRAGSGSSPRSRRGGDEEDGLPRPP